jgi:hypothetical protein
MKTDLIVGPFIHREMGSTHTNFQGRCRSRTNSQRKGNPKLCRKTSEKKFRKACKEMNIWLRKVRCTANLKEWWPTLRAKLRGHFQYYGISGNRRAIVRFHYETKRLVFKWLNRRSQKASFTWEDFEAYFEALSVTCATHRSSSVYAVVRFVSSTEEPCAGNPQARF